MELVDMQDLGSCAERRVGSTPFIRTKTEKPAVAGFLAFILCYYSISSSLGFTMALLARLRLNLTIINITADIAANTIKIGIMITTYHHKCPPEY